MTSYTKAQQTRKAPKVPKTKITAAMLLRTLLTHRQRWGADKPFIALEIGLSDDRRVDALLLSYYKPPTALEVKISRADWLNEMKDPTKHLPAREFAGQLYFVAPEGIIRVEELPPGTGLYEIKPFTSKIRNKKAADRNPPAQIDWHMAAQIAAGVLRAADQGIV